MTRLAILALLALAGCDRVNASNGEAEWQDAEQAYEIERLRGELAMLKGDVEHNRKLLLAVNASLTEARQNHAAVRETVNANVERANSGEKWQEDRLKWLEAQHGVIR